MPWSSNVVEEVRLLRERERLRSHAPDIMGSERFYKVLLRVGLEYGFSRQEMDRLDDHRELLKFRDLAIHLGLWKAEE